MPRRLILNRRRALPGGLINRAPPPTWCIQARANQPSPVGPPAPILICRGSPHPYPPAPHPPTLLYLCFMWFGRMSSPWRYAPSAGWMNWSVSCRRNTNEGTWHWGTYSARQNLAEAASPPAVPRAIPRCRAIRTVHGGFRGRVSGNLLLGPSKLQEKSGLGIWRHGGMAAWLHGCMAAWLIS